MSFFYLRARINERHLREVNNLKNMKIFIWMLLLSVVVGIVVDAIFSLFSITTFEPVDLIGDIIFGIVFSAVITYICRYGEKEMSEEEAKAIFRKNDMVVVVDTSNELVASFRNMKRLFFDGMKYDKKQLKLLGPRNLIGENSTSCCGRHL